MSAPQLPCLAPGWLSLGGTVLCLAGGSDPVCTSWGQVSEQRCHLLSLCPFGPRGLRSVPYSALAAHVSSFMVSPYNPNILLLWFVECE